MKLDILTLAFISSLTFLTQFIALLVQYILNKNYRGVSWWLLGSTFMAIGVILTPTVNIKSLELLARIANPLIILGHVFLYIGIARFINKKENKWVLILFFVVFTFFYYFFMFIYNDISARSISIASALMLISFMTAFRLYFNNDRLITGSATFTASVFFAYGCFSVVRIFILLFSPPIQAYSDQGLILEITFIIPIVVSLLWTFGFIIMLNQRMNAEYREEKEKLQLIFNTSPDAAMISRLADGMIANVNAGFLAMSGYTRAELINKTIKKINIWQNLTEREIFLNELKEKGSCENREFVFQRKDGSLFTGRISAKIITIQTEPYIISITHDITESKQAEEAIRESEELYRSILNASPDDITITDMKGQILVISPEAKKMFGYESEYDQFVGSQILDYIVPEDQQRARANIVSMFKGDYAGPNQYRGIRKDRSTFDIEVKSGLIKGANRQPAKMVFMVRDITERKQAEQQIQELIRQLEIEKNTAQLNANTDSLTGLANRRYFDDALNKEFHRLKRSGAAMSLIMLDVDHFKKFNDFYGHLAGDDCLRQIGITLKTFIKRASDIMARYGGEEFVVILTETDQYGAAAIAEQIRKAVEALAIPHAESGISEFVTISLGVVTIHTTSLASPDQVVALADEALYNAKNGGRNRTSFASENEVPGSSNPVE
jgi:diguanylate cyclase (GGDEF)-like protein/PAS domain S-box-containing protein